MEGVVTDVMLREKEAWKLNKKVREVYPFFFSSFFLLEIVNKVMITLKSKTRGYEFGFEL